MYNARLEMAMRARQAFSTSVGTKLLIALTGLCLVGFLAFHLYGNLLLFFGGPKYNEHAHALISNPLVIPAEFGLIAIFLLHVFKAVLNYFDNRAARAQGYEVKKWAGGPSRKSWGSTTMILSGIVIFIFVPLHLVTFKYGANYAAAGEPGVRDLYRLLIEVFQSPAYVVFYVVAMTVVGLHLRHGVASSLQSLGLIPAAWTRAFLAACLAVALLVGAGFVLVPIYIYLWVRP
jgi:succinate dehydrogenase / fumarate reductase, cytochrome b subunit